MQKSKEDNVVHQRRAGILLPVFSLPSRYGIGCLDSAAYRFVDFLAEAGQSEWQILPLGPTGYGDSPYQSFSSYAGSPYFVSLEALIGDRLLLEAECDAAGLEESGRWVDYGLQYERRMPLLRLAYERFLERDKTDFTAFCESHPHVMEYALFMALKDLHGGAPWNEWERDLRFREGTGMERARHELSRESGFYAFLQYRFFADFDRLHAYARGKGISIIGDLPIYVSYDSADVWASPSHFQLDEELRPTAVAGCPPDGFSPCGQLWGNPLYRWEVHEREGFAWWVSRIRAAKRLCDTLRIDHFRGFDAYYAIPKDAPDARQGRWEKGPGMALFRALSMAIPDLDVIVEDLGFVDESVRRLVRESGFPNMRVLEFGFDTRDTSAKSDHLPHNYPARCVAYLGTHDNETLHTWLRNLGIGERHLVSQYLAIGDADDATTENALLALLLRSPAERCIVTLGDWLGLDRRARINTPSTASGNWRWRVSGEQLSAALCERILEMTALYGRRNESKGDQI